MELMVLVRYAEIFLRFVLPVIIFTGLIFGYNKYKHIYERCFINKSMLALLTLGTLSTVLINVPIYIDAELIIAVNFGAIIIPLVISFVFIFEINKQLANLFRSSIVIMFVIVISMISFMLSYFKPGFGITMDFPYYFVPMLYGVLFAFILVGRSNNFYSAVPIAYSISTLGVFIGADVLQLPIAINENLRIGYLGGQGVLDMVYISGLYSLVFALFIVIINTKRSEKKEKAHRESYMIDRAWLIKPRAVAFLIDCTIQFMIIYLFYFTVFGDIHLTLDQVMPFRGIERVFLLGWSVSIHIFYFTFFEWYFGQTPGKMVTGIKVVPVQYIGITKKKKTARTSNKFLNIFTRNILRIVELVLGFYVVSMILIKLSQSEQRIGDYFADTKIICVEKEFELN